ncbi:MAG: penicillin acylase family protein, partial [Alphaproteobacteria bacterium]
RLAERLGPALVPYDRAARLFLYRGEEEAEWQAYGSRTKEIAFAFTAGINAYVTLVRQQPELLPAEFRWLGYLPELWRPADLFRMRSFGASANAAAEVRRAELACKGALDADAIAHPLEPPWQTKVPDGLEPCSVTSEDLEIYRLLRAALPLSHASGKAGSLPTASLERLAGDASGLFDAAGAEGSNAWVIAGRLTRTGRPILANDPHLGLQVPSVRYVSHLSAPGLNAVGAGWPGSPGIQNGHNDRIAFGRTNFAIDQEDVAVLETKPGDREQYFYRGRWERMTVVSEEIAVKDEAPVTVTLKYSLLGPILAEHPGHERAVALSATWLEPGAAILLLNLPYDFAGDWQEFNEALRTASFGTNSLYADVDGNIGWRPAGRVPLRPHHDGLLPVPGDGRYDWAGLMPLEDFPSAFNPPEGWLASANEMNLPRDYPYATRKIGFEWGMPDRHARIVEALKGSTAFSLADSVALQHDVLSGRAVRLAALLAGVRTDDAKLATAVSMLLSWDKRMVADSAAAALFEAWWAKLWQALRDTLIPERLRALVPFVNPSVGLAALEKPDGRFGLDPKAGRDALLLGALGRAVGELEARLGSDWSAWRWGRLHSAGLAHLLAPLLTDDQRAATAVAGGGTAGDNSTVLARWLKSPIANVSGGASFSMVLDVGAWDASLALNAPGQSGDPASAHYRDLYPRWLKGEMFPLLFSREKIEAVTETRLLLRPAP